MNNDIRRQTEKLLADVSDRTADLVETLAAPFAEPVVRLGVTGLARAGKTVAITSIIQNLLKSGRIAAFVGNGQRPDSWART